MARSGLRLEARLAVLFLALSVVPVSLGMVLLEHREASLMEDKVGDHLSTAVDLKRLAVEQWVREKAKRLEGAWLETRDAVPAGGAGAAGPGAEPAREGFARVLATDADFEELFLLDGTTGRVVLSTDPAQEGKSRDDQPYFHRAHAGPAVQLATYSMTEQRYAVVVAVPAPVPGLPDGHPLPVLAGRLGADAVLRLLEERPGLGTTGQSYAVNRLGFILSATPVGAQAASGPVALCATTGDGRGFYRDLGGDEVYGVWRWVARDGLCYAAQQHVAEAFAPLFELRRWLAAVMLPLGLIMLGLSFHVSRLIARPVAARAATEARLRSLVENLPAGIAEVDGDGRAAYVNPAFARVRAADGRPLLAVGDEVAARLRSAGAPAGTAAAVGAAVRRGAPLPAATVSLAPFPGSGPEDGGALVLTLAVHPIPGHRGSILIAVDVTQAATAERVLLRELQATNRLRTQFINQAAHELNTPLTPIKVQLHLLRRGRGADLSPAQERAVFVIERNFDRLAMLVQDLLDVARLQAGRLQTEPRPTDLRGAVAQAVETFAEPAGVAGIALHADLEAGLDVLIDPRRLSQVLFNLLSNALKFTPSGGSVAVAARRAGGHAMVLVRDTGRGLRAEDLPRLFQPFVQLHDPETDRLPGTGLGLHICKGIIEQHGGRIWAESEGPRRGSTFGFELPLVAPVAGPAAAPAAAPERATGPPEGTGTAPVRPSTPT